MRAPAATLVAVATATLASAPAAAAEGQRVPVRSCSTGSERSSEGALVAGPFGLYDADAIVRSTVRGGYLWKTPAWVAPGRPVRVAVAPRHRSRARLVFTQPSNRLFPEGDVAVRFRACRSEAGTAFSGSITTSVKALCLHLVITDEASGRRHRMRVPLRRRCRR